MTRNDEKYALVYSTDKGEICPGCQQPVPKCTCKATKAQQVLGDGKVRVRRENKGRAGKTVSSISGVPLSEKELCELAVALKRRCGTGGTCKDGVIEIQGDHVEVLLEELRKKGFQAKRSGG